MKFRNPFKSDIEHLISNEAENALYEKAANDIDEKIIDKGIWTKAYSRAQGDEVKQKVFYIELIVEHYKDLIRAGEELAHILATKEEIRQQEEEIRQQEEERIRRMREANKKREDAFSLKEFDESTKKNEKVILTVTVSLLIFAILVFIISTNL